MKNICWQRNYYTVLDFCGLSLPSPTVNLCKKLLNSCFSFFCLFTFSIKQAKKWRVPRENGSFGSEFLNTLAVGQNHLRPVQFWRWMNQPPYSFDRFFGCSLKDFDPLPLIKSYQHRCHMAFPSKQGLDHKTLQALQQTPRTTSEIHFWFKRVSNWFWLLQYREEGKDLKNFEDFMSLRA